MLRTVGEGETEATTLRIIIELGVASPMQLLLVLKLLSYLDALVNEETTPMAILPN